MLTKRIAIDVHNVLGQVTREFQLGYEPVGSSQLTREI